MEGELVAQAPRNVLQPPGREAADAGLRVKTGVEAEFFLLTPEGTEISDPNSIRPKSPATTSRR
jgi:glutamine synthetase